MKNGLIFILVFLSFSLFSSNKNISGCWCLQEEGNEKYMLQYQFLNDTFFVVSASLISKEVWVSGEGYKILNDTIFSKNLLSNTDSNQLIWEIPIISFSKKELVIFDGQENIKLKKTRKCIKYRMVIEDDGYTAEIKKYGKNKIIDKRLK